MSSNSQKATKRTSVRLLLLNPNKQLLLFGLDNPAISGKEGYSGKYWFTAGGGIDEGESIMDAAKRELFEETGINATDVEFGPTVWKNRCELMVFGKLVIQDEVFVVAKTKKSEIICDHQTENEKRLKIEPRWFSIDEIKTCEETIYPLGLDNYLPDILAENYPKEILNITKP